MDWTKEDSPWLRHARAEAGLEEANDARCVHADAMEATIEEVLLGKEYSLLTSGHFSQDQARRLAAELVANASVGALRQHAPQSFVAMVTNLFALDPRLADQRHEVNRQARLHNSSELRRGVAIGMVTGVSAAVAIRMLFALF